MIGAVVGITVVARTTSSGLVRPTKPPCSFFDLFNSPRPTPTPAKRHSWAGHVVERLGGDSVDTSRIVLVRHISICSARYGRVR